MGSAPAHHLGTIIMKFLLLIAAIASVRAEADPAFSYATGYHLPYAYGAPLTYTAAAAPVVTYAHAPVVYTAAAGHLAYSYAPYAYAGHYGYYGLGHHYGYYGRKKREATAEADAEASPEADPWLLYGGYGLPYGGYYGYGYHHAPYAYLGGCRNYLGGLVPCAAGR